MTDRPTAKNEAAKRETAENEEAYQPLWDTDQSIPEYMLLLMDQQPSITEDAELYEESDDEDEELECPDQHPDPDYEYVYPGAPKRYYSAGEDSDDEDTEHEEDEPEDSHDTDKIDEPEDIPEDAPENTHESRKDEEATHPVALASAEQAQQAQTQATHAYGEYVRLGSLGLNPGAILPVIPEPLFGIPDSKLIEMRLLDRSPDASAPMQACAAHLNPVKNEENPLSRAAMLQPVGYVPLNRPPTRYSVEDLKEELNRTNILLGVLLALNPFVLAPLASIVEPDYGYIVAFIFIVIGLGSFFVVPVLWIMGIVRLFKRRDKINKSIEEGQTPPAEFWYYLVYNRLPDGYTGINGYTKNRVFSMSMRR